MSKSHFAAEFICYILINNQIRCQCVSLYTVSVSETCGLDEFNEQLDVICILLRVCMYINAPDVFVFYNGNMKFCVHYIAVVFPFCYRIKILQGKMSFEAQ